MLKYIDTKMQLADILTKSFPGKARMQFEALLRIMGFKYTPLPSVVILQEQCETPDTGTMHALFRLATNIVSNLTGNDAARLALMNTPLGPEEITNFVALVKPQKWFDKSIRFLEAVGERGNSCGDWKEEMFDMTCAKTLK